MERVSNPLNEIINSNLIRTARALLDWTAKDLAEKSGVSVATIQRLESGKTESKNLTIDNYNRIISSLTEAGIEFTQFRDSFVDVQGVTKRITLKERPKSSGLLDGHELSDLASRLAGVAKGLER